MRTIQISPTTAMTNAVIGTRSMVAGEPPPKVATVTSHAVLAYVAVALAAGVVLATYSLASACRKEISRP